MGAKTSPAAAVFAKVLRAFETGGFTCPDVLAEVELLLATGASPTELLEILRRRKLIEPLPDYAYAEVLGLLNDAMGRVATHAAVSDEARNAEPEIAIDQIPDLVPAPIPSPSIAPPEVRSKGPPTKATTVVLTSPRNPDLTPTATPNRTTDSTRAMTPIQIAISKQAARLGSARIPTPSPAHDRGPAPTLMPGPIPAIGPSRRLAEGASAAVSRVTPTSAINGSSTPRAPAGAPIWFSTSPGTRGSDYAAGDTPTAGSGAAGNSGCSARFNLR